MTRFLLAAALAAAPAFAVGQTKPAKIAEADPVKLKADPDFAVQGEYEGTELGGSSKWGVQVIARGGGRFDIRYLTGGLPGAGWDGAEPKTAAATTVSGKVIVGVKNKPNLGEIADGVMSLQEGNDRATYKRVERKSPTLGAKPPEGAVVLFAGPGDESKWEGGKLTKLSDGEFLAASGTRTKKLFTDFTAHVEFRLAWMPNSTGQGRSNSGVYVQDRYEVQVLDSFGLKGVDNECGGIYKESAPKVNMCLPPGVWQTYDIEFTAAKFDGDKKTAPAVITVKHNGVVIHDKLQLKGATPGGKFAKEVPQPGALFFQNHGDPVVFRNVWVKETK